MLFIKTKSPHRCLASWSSNPFVIYCKTKKYYQRSNELTVKSVKRLLSTSLVRLDQTHFTHQSCLTHVPAGTTSRIARWVAFRMKKSIDFCRASTQISKKQIHQRNVFRC